MLHKAGGKLGMCTPSKLRAKPMSSRTRPARTARFTCTCAGGSANVTAAYSAAVCSCGTRWLKHQPRQDPCSMRYGNAAPLLSHHEWGKGSVACNRQPC